MLRAILSSPTHTAANRRLAKDLVWRWVGSRWPFLVPSAAVMERSHIESALPGRALSVATSDDGSEWSLSVAIQEREHAPVWVTRASVADTGRADRLALETTCSDPGAAPVIAPPAVLGAWVDRLALHDADVPVLAVPRFLDDEEQATTFLAQVAAQRRRLPLLLLAAKGESKYYGADPRVLAEAVRGLAHVACLAAPALRTVSAAWGRALAPVPGAVRIYVPGAPLQPEAARCHPTVHPAREATAPDGARRPAGDFRRQLLRRLCQLSVAAAA